MTHTPRHSRDAVNEIFGDASEAPLGERDYSSLSEDDADNDQWLKDNVPPHHG
ncbi:MAG: hypothetical protein K0U76_13515 [Actinomycetia bacterium]|nr:hypothetical protein [Actinomycetes bacterium]MCH9702368.1 hypothetical protein [Actinomycetes bacterium]MCH9761438.1 hypothetical protein [Actinomycetes bacterium]